MSAPVTVLIIDDEPQIRRAVTNALKDEASRVVEAGTGRAGIDLAAAERPDVILLDLGLPDISGINVCREIRGWSLAPIIVLSARNSEQEKVALLDVGADDYITKPFSTLELKARVRAQLRRATMDRNHTDTSTLDIDGLTINLANRIVSRSGVDIHLTPTEWSLLREFVASAGKTLTHQHLFQKVWGPSSGDAQSYLRVYVANLRRKIEVDPVRPRLIITEPGVGYRFQAR